jgi:hypothetical protein
MSMPITFNSLAEASGAGIFPRWMAFLGYGLTLLLLLSIGSFYWAPLVFPLWVLLISIYILLANLLPKETFS